MKRFLQVLTVLTVVAASGFAVAAQTPNAVREGDPSFQLPDEVKSFVEAGQKAIAYAKADLTLDGVPDYVVVVERVPANAEEALYLNERTMLILVRNSRDGKLGLVGYNDKVVFCRGCIGAIGDPFESLTVVPGSFWITNRGGFRDRWFGRYEFEFSSRDQTWLLARVAEANYELVDPKPKWTKTYAFPKHFGKIYFDDFDPNDFLGKGTRGAARSKTREVNIYLLQYPEDDQTKPPNVVRAIRRVNAKAPLTGAIKEMLAAMVENKEATDLNNYLYRLEFVSARIKNGTARLDFNYEQDVQFDWLSKVNPYFPEIIQKTAMQFPNVKRVLMCINGYEERENEAGFYAVGCDKEWEKK